MPFQWHVLNQNTSTFLLIYVLKIWTSTIQKLTFNSTVFLERGRTQAGKRKPESERVGEEGEGEEKQEEQEERDREREGDNNNNLSHKHNNHHHNNYHHKNRKENSLFFEGPQGCVTQLTMCAKGKNFKCLPIPSSLLSMISALGSLLMY